MPAAKSYHQYIQAVAQVAIKCCCLNQIPQFD